MALQIEGLARRFVLTSGGNTRTLEDPDPGMTPDHVRDHYAVMYPEAATAKVTGPKMEGGVAVYTIAAGFGTKG